MSELWVASAGVFLGRDPLISSLFRATTAAHTNNLLIFLKTKNRKTNNQTNKTSIISTKMRNCGKGQRMPALIEETKHNRRNKRGLMFASSESSVLTLALNMASSPTHAPRVWAPATCLCLLLVGPFSVRMSLAPWDQRTDRSSGWQKLL